jgi:mannose/fructose/N-acetylgalactosamine-specific phosphotransferase system component IIB
VRVGEVAFVLVRIDDRLIHGQVSVAWGTWLGCDRIILVNDAVAETPWKRDLYAATDSLGAAVSVLTAEAFLDGVASDAWASERAIVVVETPRDLVRLLRGGLSIDEVNVGGMHHTPGKRELLPYVYVDDDDVSALVEAANLGVRLVAMDVPQAAPMDVLDLLDAG